MTVLACFQGTSPTFLELLDEHDEVTAQVTIDYYKQFYDGP